MRVEAKIPLIKGALNYRDEGKQLYSFTETQLVGKNLSARAVQARCK